MFFMQHLLWPYKENEVYGLSYLRERRYIKLKQSLATEKEDKNTNIMSNGSDTLSLMLHGNWNIPFQTMVTSWHIINFNMNSEHVLRFTVQCELWTLGVQRPHVWTYWIPHRYKTCIHIWRKNHCHSSSPPIWPFQTHWKILKHQQCHPPSQINYLLLL